jgi:hypothetical protein
VPEVSTPVRIAPDEVETAIGNHTVDGAVLITILVNQCTVTGLLPKTISAV